MLTILDLLTYFWIGMTLLVILILLLISPPMRVKVWYLLVLISFPFWAQPLIARQSNPLPFWFYLLPAIWVVCTLWLAFPKTDPREPPSQTGEPRTTLEALRGSAGTSEALRIYFTLVFLVAVLGLFFFRITLSNFRF